MMVVRRQDTLIEKPDLVLLIMEWNINQFAKCFSMLKFSKAQFENKVVEHLFIFM